MGKEFSITPRAVPRVETKFRRIVTSLPHPDSVATLEKLRQYEPQAGLYVYGLESATGARVTRVTYVFASAEVEQSAGEPAALAEAARAYLQA